MAEAPDPLDPRSVHDRASFLANVKAMAEDYRLCAPHGRMAMMGGSPYAGLWDNLTIGEFLDAGAAWVESFGRDDTDFPGSDAAFPAVPTYAAFATFLFMCKSRYPGKRTQG